MIILGIDPALTVSGYGVIATSKSGISLIEAGVIKTSARETTAQRLDKIYQAVMKLIKDTRPEVMVLEKIFSHYKHPTTSYVLGQARGVMCLAANKSGIELVEYAATRVKKAVVGRGLASKLQVQRMVAETLKLNKLPAYLDVTDALALAIAHNFIVRFNPTPK